MLLINKRKNCKRTACSVKRIANRKYPFANRYPLSAEKGFTLIEILIATSILGVIGLTILTTFASGLHVFERVQTFGGSQADVLLAFEEMEKDIRNVFPLSTIAFEGDAQSIAFPTVIEIFEGNDGEEDVVSSIGRISYFIDDATYINEVAKGLIRVQHNYSQAVAGAQAHVDEGETLASIEGLAFEYYYYDEQAEAYGWQSSWSAEEENLLSGVKIAMTYKDGDRDVQIERTIFIPVLQKIIEIEEEEGEGEEEEGSEGE